MLSFKNILCVLNMTGYFPLSFIGLLAYTAIMTHITIIAVTVYLHRHQSHRAIDLTHIPSHFFRFWLWLTTGMVTKEWVAVHRCHHAHVDTPLDPHSPIMQGIRTILWTGVIPYRKAARQKALLERYGTGTPNDWIERNLYTKHPVLGVVTMLGLNILLFGWPGILVWGVQMAWIPFLAAGVVNGIGHYYGYRNYSTNDHSKNFFPIGILIGGEELHNNHHAFPYAANLARRWFEIDIGFYYIKLLSMLKLARIKYRAASLNNPFPELAKWSLLQVNQHKLKLLQSYDQYVNIATLKSLKLPKRLGRLMNKSCHLLTPNDIKRLKKLCEQHPQLSVITELKQSLHDILHTKRVERKITDLLAWCSRCKETKINCLIEFSTWLESLIGDKEYV